MTFVDGARHERSVPRAPQRDHADGQAAEAEHADGQTATKHDDEPERLDLAALPTAPSEARQFTRKVLERWRCGPEVIDAATLAVSELTTNSARALNPDLGDLTNTSPGPPKHLALTLRRLPGQVMIEVSDDAPDLPLLTDADADAESGRGLLIVQASSERWGYRYPPAGGKVVFCVISTDHAQKESAT
jgi:Histidine kinase-like ATPase domain